MNIDVPEMARKANVSWGIVAFLILATFVVTREYYQVKWLDVQNEKVHLEITKSVSDLAKTVVELKGDFDVYVEENDAALQKVKDDVNARMDRKEENHEEAYHRE